MLQAAISEVKFHPTQPDHVITCSQGGDVCHWNSVGVRSRDLTRDTRGDQFSNVSPWLRYYYYNTYYTGTDLGAGWCIMNVV